MRRFYEMIVAVEKQQILHIYVFVCARACVGKCVHVCVGLWVKGCARVLARV
jgi:hypothetical protein